MWPLKRKRNKATSKKLRPVKRIEFPVQTGQEPFFVAVSPEQLREQKQKAGELRKTQWWKRRVARGVCYYCHRKMLPAELTMDHIVALIRGGKSTRANTVPACKQCNSRKKYLLPIEWDQYLRDATGRPPEEADDSEQS
jgi:5-methylcytosine-specific restriction endonuclease McrA